jgi:hypothetical protein
MSIERKKEKDMFKVRERAMDMSELKDNELFFYCHIFSHDFFKTYKLEQVITTKSHVVLSIVTKRDEYNIQLVFSLNVHAHYEKEERIKK